MITNTLKRDGFINDICRSMLLGPTLLELLQTSGENQL